MEDREIVEGILKDGKTQLFALVVKKYEGAVFAKSLAITKQQETAREVTQQTFIRAFRTAVGDAQFCHGHQPRLCHRGNEACHRDRPWSFGPHHAHLRLSDNQ